MSIDEGIRSNGGAHEASGHAGSRRGLGMDAGAWGRRGSEGGEVGAGGHSRSGGATNRG